MKNQMLIGAHTSAAGGVFNALYEGQKIGATVIQLFTSNQKQWKGKIITKEVVQKWEEALMETGITHVMSHDSYLINLGCPHEENLEKSRQAFLEELQRCHTLRIPYLNFHPGAALKEGEEKCLDTIVASLLALEEVCSKGETKLVLETTAGQGSNVGWKFEHLGYIIDRVKNLIPIGVCIDTCHIFAAGYDIRDKKGWDKTLTAFEACVGLEHLVAFHLNDSMKPLGSRVDRHEALGKGHIGFESFEILMTHPNTKHLPKYLETPGGCPLWVEEIASLKQCTGESP